MLVFLLLLILSLFVFSAEIPNYNIAIVPKNKSNPFFLLALQGCEDAAAELNLKQTYNVECWYKGTWNEDINGTIAIIDELIDDDECSAIVVSVTDPVAYNSVIDRGILMNKPIYTFDSDAPDSTRLVYIGTNNTAMGRGLGKLLKKNKPGGGRFGMVTGHGDNLVERVRGVREELDGSNWVEVGTSPYNGKEDIYISMKAMWDLVSDYPDIDAIVGVVGLVSWQVKLVVSAPYCDRSISQCVNFFSFPQANV